ncbi:hypothetical protein EMIHUDRAFT_211612 [Emiliania huxleyi CCMP1516]|uniref:Uncharacterized protein n=2 Tax=Emiliania huxleyi TaxID=2903 RepID=A0A0D3IVX4_EMIH1|nr:hypothetical protein EMIHUDRAFT_211612 [Emiliania huxleyi CCMP1516]EOD15409.1 hypothetical protein EMIHUDRAFT_211612 [Emiliania huxleyi CCMP1516]|eukprot:XP_005767838.1 hypothetical protein EMIHUDRAFT_211612 [Emiliania huxleyi CCMP1516]
MHVHASNPTAHDRSVGVWSPGVCLEYFAIRCGSGKRHVFFAFWTAFSVLLMEQVAKSHLHFVQKAAKDSWRHVALSACVSCKIRHFVAFSDTYM